MLRLTASLIALLNVCAACPSFAEQRTLTVEQAVRLALESNSDVLALAATVEASKARLAGASLLLQTNPSLTFTAGPRSSPAGGSYDHSVQALQLFEIAGQRRARIDASQAALDSTRAQAEALRSEVTARVKEAFGRALAAEQRSQLETEALAVVQQGVNAAEERFRAGAAALLEVNTARIELGRAARGRGESERRRAESLAELQLLLGLDLPEGLTLRGDLSPARDPVASATELVEEALERRSEMRAASRDLDSAKAESRLATREGIPSPRIGASFAREEESATTIVQGVVAFDLPVFNRNQAARGVAAARVSQAETALRATERRIRLEVSTAVARAQAARAAADGYAASVVKAMQDNMELGTESYRAGKIDFLQLLVIRRQTLDARREHIDVLEELNAARAQLDRALGRAD